MIAFPRSTSPFLPHWRTAARISFRAMLAGALVLAASGCSTIMAPSNNVSVSQTGNNPAPAAPAVPEGTDPEDAVIGLREHPRIIASYGGVFADRQAEFMLARIVGRLLAAAEQPNSKFTVTILDSAEVNAFALPGGYIYVTRGILALASDTSELAAVLSHEIAHVTLRHARARASRARTNQIVDKVTTVFGGAAPDGSTDRTKQNMASFSQAQELAADQEGIRIASRAGYDAGAAARFLGAMGRFANYAAGKSGSGGDFLSSHPSTPDRIQKASEIALAVGTPGLGETDRDGYMSAVDGLLFGDSPRQGAIVGRRFIHPSMNFTFAVPSGYTLQNGQNAVVGVAGDGEAVRFDSAEVSNTVGLADYLKSGWIAGLDSSTVVQRSENGLEMASGIARTEQWNFRVAVVRFDGQVYRFIFAAKADSPRFAQGADETLRSFRRTTPADLTGVRQVSLKVVTAKGGETADSLARQMAGLTRGAELFYIINNMYPGDPVEPGKRYKVVVVR